MAKYCDGCKSSTAVIPFAVHEHDMTRLERDNKRLWLVVIILIAALIATNMAWIVYEASEVTVDIDQDVDQQAESGNNIFVGGDSYGHSESTDAD